MPRKSDGGEFLGPEKFSGRAQQFRKKGARILGKKVCKKKKKALGTRSGRHEIPKAGLICQGGGGEESSLEKTRFAEADWEMGGLLTQLGKTKIRCGISWETRVEKNARVENWTPWPILGKNQKEVGGGLGVLKSDGTVY